jgi:acyl-coenzyme A thioesterase PaaI-like protein
MGVTTTLNQLVPSVDGPTNLIRTMWDRLHWLPGGRRVFSRGIGMAAPYTNSIGAVVVELGDNYSKVTMRDRRAVRNHLRCVHAIALCNLAELTANVALGYSLPDDGRFIVAGLSIDYIKKARGTISATCECPSIESSARREYAVPVIMRDPEGVIVARATLRTLVGPKPTQT